MSTILEGPLVHSVCPGLVPSQAKMNSYLLVGSKVTLYTPRIKLHKLLLYFPPCYYTAGDKVELNFPLCYCTAGSNVTERK